MHDIRFIRTDPAAFDAGLARRGLEPAAEALLAVDAELRSVQTELQAGQARRNEASRAFTRPDLPNLHQSRGAPMQSPHTAMVVVADGRKMLLFRNQGDEQFPNLSVVTHDEKPVPAREDFATDEPGTYHDMGAGMQHKSGYEETDFQQLEEDRFAADVAEMLKARALRNEFDKLIVVAPPKALGELRKNYHKEVEARLIGEIAKDLTNRPTDEIEALICKSYNSEVS